MVGELVAFSQATVSHKHFISVLVRRRAGVSLPLEIDFSLGMRKYVVLINGERGTLPKFHKGLGKYVLALEGTDADTGASLERRFTHEISSTEKGKTQKLAFSTVVEHYSRSLNKDVCLELWSDGDRPTMIRIKSDEVHWNSSRLVPQSAVVEPSSYAGCEEDAPRQQNFG